MLRFLETVRAAARGQYKLKKQTGGPGQYAVVDVVVRPLERGGGFRFIDGVVEGRVPKDFVPAVEKGVREGLARGPLRGSTLVDLSAELVDGAFHKNDSHARDFQFAALMAFKDAVAKAAPALLEPWVELRAWLPSPALGTVLGRLAARRGRVRSNDFEDGGFLVRAALPESEAAAFEAELRKSTSGRARLTWAPLGHELMPEALARRQA
jgi:elongation factor G